MGKRILQRRRGKGGIQWRVSSRGKIAPVRYPLMNPDASGHEGKLTVKALLDERGRSAPLAQLQYGEHGAISYVPAINGIAVGNEVQHGPDAAVANGNILPLRKIPEGTRISNIELRAGDGGKLVRAAGGSAVLFSKGEGRAIVRLPSGKSMLINENCRATVGEIAGGGMQEKPFMRAGPRHHKMTGRRPPLPEDERNRDGGGLPPVRRRQAPAPRQVDQHLEERAARQEGRPDSAAGRPAGRGWRGRPSRLRRGRERREPCPKSSATGVTRSTSSTG